MGCDGEILHEEALVVKRFGKQPTSVVRSNIKEARRVSASSDTQTFWLRAANSTEKLAEPAASSRHNPIRTSGPASRMVTGSCACGGLTYSFNSDPLVCVGVDLALLYIRSTNPYLGLQALCHCNGCKRSSSSVYTHNLLIPAARFTTSGNSKAYKDKGESGKDRSFHFCPECGTTLYIVSENIPGVIVVKGGTLDDLRLNERKYRPTFEIFCKDKYSWLPDIEGSKKFDGAMKH